MDKNLTELCRTAASFILKTPGEEAAALTRELTGTGTGTEECAEDFFNAFCLSGTPDSFPPYEQAVRDFSSGTPFRGPDRERSEALDILFGRFGFDWKSLAENQPTVGGLMASDHLGFELLFIASLLSSGEEKEAERFAREKRGIFLSYAERLSASASPYVRSTGLLLSAAAYEMPE